MGKVGVSGGKQDRAAPEGADGFESHALGRGKRRIPGRPVSTPMMVVVGNSSEMAMKDGWLVALEVWLLEEIATYQAPGRYILNSRIEMECPRRPSSENGSSPEHHVGNLPVTKLEKDDIEDNEHKIHSTPKPVESDINEKIDIEQNSPDQLTNDRKVNNEEGACSSSESGSDSDSESDSSDSGSDSGSQSRSRSKSQSPAGSGSASSSDSESDGSSSSKEGSDVDVDIMTSDDDKEEAGNTLPASSRLSPSPGENKAYDEKGKENVIETVNLDFQRASLPMTAHDYERGDGASAGEEIEGKSKKSRITTSENYEAATLKIVSDDFQMDVQNLDEHMALHDQYHQPVLQSISSGNSKVDKSEHVVRHGSTDKQCIRKDFNNLKQSDGTQVIPKAKPKRASDPKHFQEKPQSSKRPRATNTGADVSSGKSRDNSFAEKSRLVSPDRSETGQRKGQMMLTSSDMDQDRSTFDSQKDPDGVWAGRYMVHENAMRRKAFDGTEKSARYNDNNRTSRLPEKSYFHADETDTPGTRSTFFQGKLSMPKDKLHKEVRDVHMDANEKYSAKSLLDDAGGDKMPFVPDSLYRRSGDQNGAQKDTKLSLDIHKADIDKCVLNSEKGVSLRREPSDLELGEFREPLPNEDAKEGTRQFERKDSFKSADMKVNVMDNFSSDSNKRRTPSKVVRELKESPSVSKCVTQTKQDWPCRRMSEGDIMDSTAPQQRTTAQGQQFPRMDRPEHDFVSHLDGPSMSDIAIRSEIRNSRGGQENHVGSHRKTSTIGLPHQDPKHNGNHVACKTVMDSKPQKFNGLSNASDHKEIFQVESLLSEKRLDSSSDEDNSFYAKYDKNEPELRGPIKDYSQYKEYVQEYREKYDCYSSLDRHLEKYRNDFMKVGHDLEYLKIRDCEAYHNVGEQIIQMYHQCRKCLCGAGFVDQFWLLTILAFMLSSFWRREDCPERMQFEWMVSHKGNAVGGSPNFDCWRPNSGEPPAATVGFQRIAGSHCQILAVDDDLKNLAAEPPQTSDSGDRRRIPTAGDS
ncbi:hypothetical protein Taro_025915, partial [Colocasia esculenta]|nr:hypothetical protein [Colocasia esculenta]